MKVSDELLAAVVDAVDARQYLSGVAPSTAAVRREVAEFLLYDKPAPSHNEVRAALLEAERLGCVVRTGRTKGTRWWLG